MRRWLLLVVALTAFAAVGVPRGGAVALSAQCSAGFVDGTVGGVHKCLRAGEFCSPAHEADYERSGFSCVAGHLRVGGTAPSPVTPVLGRTVVLARRTRAGGCRRGTLPDRRCSPGAFYSGLTAAVLCSSAFRTSTVRNVPQSEKFAVERAYGLPERLYARTIEIDHIVPLELGGSNDIANLFPEPGSGAYSYHDKDRLENRLHDLVCGGQLGLAAARRAIAVNWEAEYRGVF
jgi:hypothetical protein